MPEQHFGFAPWGCHIEQELARRITLFADASGSLEGFAGFLNASDSFELVA